MEWVALRTPGYLLPDPGIQLESLASLAMIRRFLTSSTTWEAPPMSQDDFKKVKKNSKIMQSLQNMVGNLFVILCAMSNYLRALSREFYVYLYNEFSVIIEYMRHP